MKSPKNILLLISLFTLLALQAGYAQSNQLETEKGIAASIAPYDADVRQAILVASEHPEVLTQLEKNQNATSSQFQNIVGGFRQAKQVWFYTLTRYPELIHTLAIQPDGLQQTAVEQLLPNQDTDLKEAAWKVYDREKKDLIKIDEIQTAAAEDFDRLIRNLDVSARAAFQKLASLPDVLILLTNNVELTTRLGKQYQDNPRELNNHLTALHDSLHVQNQYEITAFKNQLANDPDAMKEYGQAANDYASANGYALPGQLNYVNDAYYYGNPYSYWFGYPSWYTYPNWYPGSFGYNSGFYSGAGGFGFYGFPSYGFATWFYGRGYYNRYPHLYRQFGNYYRGNVGSNRVMGSVNRGFMGEAGRHYNPNDGTRYNQLSSPSNFNRMRGQYYQNRGNSTHMNSNTYHTQSWGTYGGRGNGMNGGSRPAGGGTRTGGSRGRH
jgi:hypothetical protein